MKKSLLILLLIFYNFNSYSQNWQLVNSNTTDEIVNIHFQNEINGFLITANGKIMKTTDAGQNWNLIYEDNELFTDQTIVATTSKVVAFGLNVDGILKKLEFPINSTDFQISNFTHVWTPKSLITYNDNIYEAGWLLTATGFIPLTSTPTSIGTSISTISYVSNYGGNLLGSDNYYVYFSTNGINWNTIQFHDFFLNSIPYQGYWDGGSKFRAVTNYPCVVHISNDSGVTWSFNQIDMQSLFYYFVNSENVLALNLFDSDNKIYSSTDSGINFIHETVSDPVKKIYNYNSNLIFAFGENGKIFKSTNAGGLLNVNQISVDGNSITIYPNPTKSKELNIKYKSEGLKVNSISVYNGLGQLITNYDGRLETLNLVHQSDGIYKLKFETAEGLIIKNVVKN